MKDERALTTRLLSEASQENCDGYEHDLMIEAAERIKELEQQLQKLERSIENCDGGFCYKCGLKE